MRPRRAECRIEHLTVVAGPKGVGKSHFIRRLAEDELLRRRVGIPAGAHVCTERNWLRRESTPREVGHLVLHYDILRLFDRGETRYDRDPATAVFRSADRITFLTLRTNRERLCAQFDRRLCRRKGRRKLERLRRLRVLYDDDQFLADWYARWSRFVAGWADATVGNYLVDVHESYTLTPLVVDARRAGIAIRRRHDGILGGRAMLAVVGFVRSRAGRPRPVTPSGPEPSVGFVARPWRSRP